MIWFFSQLPKLAADIGKDCPLNKTENPFFGFPKWWKYIDKGEKDGLGNCAPKVNFSDGLGEVWAIAFAVIDMMLYAAGVLAVIFIIVGGIAYMTADGSPEKAAAARKRLLNALLGLVIVLMASVVVSFIGRALG